ncbi:hypothetical protein DD235_07535 [Corticimicrobacter populi]|uniref:Uncharacterized protein n=1 Tax=Corticimicrobacter populi TaxID=2175229 RepID=A0A2V1K5H9_9BURK|nr:hypothetical protein DD235_07535 [Corticimicrobacter populi]
MLAEVDSFRHVPKNEPLRNLDFIVIFSSFEVLIFSQFRGNSYEKIFMILVRPLIRRKLNWSVGRHTNRVRKPRRAGSRRSVWKNYSD